MKVQMVWMMMSFIRTNLTMATVYTLSDLSRLRYLGDKNAVKFMEAWNRMTINLEDAIGSQAKQRMFFEKIQYSEN